MKKAHRIARAKYARSFISSCSVFMDGPVSGLMRVCASQIRYGRVLRAGSYAYLSLETTRPSEAQMKALVEASIIKGRMLNQNESLAILLSQALS